MPLCATPRCLPGAEVQVPVRSSSREGAQPGWEDVTHPTALQDLRVREGRGWQHGHQQSSASSSDPVFQSQQETFYDHPDRAGSGARRGHHEVCGDSLAAGKGRTLTAHQATAAPRAAGGSKRSSNPTLKIKQPQRTEQRGD